MWIRSQDKKRLIKVSDVEIVKHEVDSTPIGEVKTKVFRAYNSLTAAREEGAKFIAQNDVKLISDNWRMTEELHSIYYYVTINYQEIQRNYVYDILGGNVILGTYSSEERALSILDAMVKAIRRDLTVLINSEYAKKLREDFGFNRNDIKKYALEKDIVIHMPQDEEVEK